MALKSKLVSWTLNSNFMRNQRLSNAVKHFMFQCVALKFHANSLALTRRNRLHFVSCTSFSLNYHAIPVALKTWKTLKTHDAYMLFIWISCTPSGSFLKERPLTNLDLYKLYVKFSLETNNSKKRIPFEKRRFYWLSIETSCESHGSCEKTSFRRRCFSRHVVEISCESNGSQK